MAFVHDFVIGLTENGSAVQVAAHESKIFSATVDILAPPNVVPKVSKWMNE